MLWFAPAVWAEDTPPPGLRPETISAGTYHSCGVRSNGTVACWGDNSQNQATPPAGTFSQVSAGSYHTCGLKTDGTVACWGNNSQSQATPPASTFTQVSAGAAHTCGLKSDGTVTCWGYNYNGEASPPAGTFTQISAGYAHTCGLKSDSTIACWGKNNWGQATPPAGAFTQISAGGEASNEHTCGVRSDGTVACWGYNGYGTASPPAGTFTQISAGSYHNCGVKSAGTVTCWGYNYNGEASPPAGTFTQVSAGLYHTCGVRSDGSVACWGYNGYGQASPPVGTFQRPTVSADYYHTCGLKSDGSAACWGDNTYGQATPPAGTFSQLTAGGTHSCGLKSDGSVACWGDNTYGQVSPPVGTFSQLSSGYIHTCGVRSDGTVACWGDNSQNQSTPPAGTFSQVSAGLYHTCGVKSDGSVACWGEIWAGQTSPPAGTFTQLSASWSYTCGVKSNGSAACWGDNTYGQTSPPAGTFTQVSAGRNYTCGVKSDGGVACWGNNELGQTPPAGTFSQLTAGYFHTCGVKSDGSVACWGWNDYGQLGPTLTVSTAGTGSGTVSSNPLGIDCGSTCRQTYPPLTDTIVELNATPASGSTFAGWSGACTNTTGMCTVMMDTGRNVTATFDRIINNYTLTVTKAGTGSGTVASTPAGINCGSDCSENYTNGTVVTLTATPASGSSFVGWNGECAGGQVTLTAAKTCTATFNATDQPSDNFANAPLLQGANLTVSATNQSATKEAGEPNHNGNSGGHSVWWQWTAPTTGTVVIDTFGSNFDTLLGVYTGTQVTALTVVASNDDTNGFQSQVSFQAVAGTRYAIVVDGYRSVTGNIVLHLTFTARYPLTVTTTGSGTVTSNPTGITCGSDCSEEYDSGTVVMLTATPASGSSFVGWSGACSGTGTCQIIMSQARAVTATFTLSCPNDRDCDGIPDAIETSQGTNPDIKDNDIFNKSRLFVMQQYRDFLHREGDADGINYWSRQLDRGAVDRAAVADLFLTSPEFEGRVAPLVRLYLAYFLRLPDYNGLWYWVDRLSSGMSLPAISQAFADSAEFQQRYGALDCNAFLTLVYQNVLGRDPEPEGLAYWQGQLCTGTMTRGDVMLAFAQSAEYQQRTGHQVLAVMLYVGLLQREPEQAGFDYWVGQLQAGMTRRQVLIAFMSSPEYYQRFLP